MTKDEAIAHFGTQQKLAERLAIKQSTVSGWVAVPLHHQMFLERITNGALRADPHPAESAA